MEVVNIEKLINSKEKYAVAIGFFDGVHLGHQAVIKNAIQTAKENQIKSVVITFDKSPKVALGIVKDEKNLTSEIEKLRLFEELGVDYTLILKFDKAFLNLHADEFIEKFLLKINAIYVSVGFDFKFGQKATGDTDLLKSYSQFKTEITDPIQIASSKVSTTKIKKNLSEEKLEQANKMLGRAYSVTGKVILGQQLGQTIGFPTANLQLGNKTLIPPTGVYATTTYINERKFASMTNIGYNPTANLQDHLSIETHLLNADLDLYNKQIRVAFHKKIRDEKKFENITELVEQLEKDKKFVEKTTF